MVNKFITIGFYFEQRRVDNMDKYLIPKKRSLKEFLMKGDNK